MKRAISRVLSFVMVACCLIGLTAPAAFAASIAESTINMNADCSIQLYKYDLTNAAKDGVWDNSYVSTGVYDQNVNDILGNSVPKGDQDGKPGNPLGNGGNSNGYAIKGVEFSYLKVANIVTFTESVNDGHADYNKTMVLYGMDKNLSKDLLKAIGLENGKNAYPVNTGKLDFENNWFYESDALMAALRNSLAVDPTATKNALEKYMEVNKAASMPLTDENGYSKVEGLKVGLYLVVETKVPEMVTCTTNPFFLSLPMTAVNGNNVSTGGSSWNYNPVLYPKNETGIVTLEKTVREALKDTATHTGSLTDITDGYKHNATASAGDAIEFQIISTLPTITSNATALSEYTFFDNMANGITYTKGDVKLEWFSNKECTPDKLVATWTEADGKFTVEYGTAKAANPNTMKIVMSASGLAEINTAADSFANVNNNSNGDNVNFAGYSNYTVRITYGAKINSDNSFVYGDAANCNKVSLTWRRTSSEYFDMLTDDCHIYSYGIDVTKIFSGLSSEAADKEGKFGDVKFKLQNASDNYYVVAKLNASEGIYYVTGHTTNEAEATAFTPVTQFAGTKQQEFGQIVIKGLEDDSYILTETETANGYTLLRDNIDIVITTNDDAKRPCSVYTDEEKLGVTQNDGHYFFDGIPELPLANMPQVQLSHNFLTASATVDGNAVAMKNDTDPVTHEDSFSTNALVTITVINTQGWDIPSTGDTSMAILTLCGTAMVVMAFGIIFLLALKSKKSEEK